MTIRIGTRLAMAGATIAALVGLLQISMARGQPAASPAATARPTTQPSPSPSPSPDRTIELRGEVVETGCFIIGARRGQAHRQCAIACARAGQSLGVLDETSGLLYVSVLDHRTSETTDPLLPHIAEIVEARGLPVEFGDLPGLVVTEVRSLGPAD